MAGSRKVCLALEKQTSTIIQDADVNTEVKGYNWRGLLCAGEVDHLIFPSSSKDLVLHGSLRCASGAKLLCKVDSILDGVYTLK